MVNHLTVIPLTLILLMSLSSTALATEMPFEDVTEEDAHYEAVALLYQAGRTEGVSETQFGEDQTVTRQ